jgi:Cu(I)/Ag(I) efflux system membrane fusion protein
MRVFLILVLTAVTGLASGYRWGTGRWPDADVLKVLAAVGADRPAPTGEAGPTTSGERKILYYRNPMGLPDTSPVPKKDWMGMDYIPVYEGEAEDDGASFTVSLDRVQRAGVRSVPAEMRRLVRPVRAFGKIALDESRQRIVALRFDGFIEKLYANTTGQAVRKGESLFRVFSTEVLSALANYRVSLQSSGKRSGRQIDGARQRLANLEVPEQHIRTSADAGDIADAIDWPSPVSGTVMERMVTEGERAEAGRALLRIADLSEVWVIAEVAEQDLGLVRAGATAELTLRAMPSKPIEAKVEFVYPELNAATRAGRIRIRLANPDLLLRPEMFADVTIDAGSTDAPRLVVPADSVIDSGNRQLVIVDKGDGRFEPRAVTLGARGNGLVEIVAGIAAGDRVVETANFLIDAESNLRSALKSLAPGASLNDSAAGLGSTDGAQR